MATKKRDKITQIVYKNGENTVTHIDQYVYRKYTENIGIKYKDFVFMIINEESKYIFRELKPKELSRLVACVLELDYNNNIFMMNNNLISIERRIPRSKIALRKHLQISRKSFNLWYSKMLKYGIIIENQEEGKISVSRDFFVKGSIATMSKFKAIKLFSKQIKNILYEDCNKVDSNINQKMLNSFGIFLKLLTLMEIDEVILMQKNHNLVTKTIDYGTLVDTIGIKSHIQRELKSIRKIKIDGRNILYFDKIDTKKENKIIINPEVACTYDVKNINSAIENYDNFREKLRI